MLTYMVWCLSSTRLCSPLQKGTQSSTQAKPPLDVWKGTPISPNSTELLSSRLQGWMQGWMPPTCQDGGSQMSANRGRRCIPHRADNEKNEALLPLVPTKIRAIEKRKEKRNRKEMCTATVRLQTSCGGWLCFVFVFA